MKDFLIYANTLLLLAGLAAGGILYVKGGSAREETMKPAAEIQSQPPRDSADRMDAVMHRLDSIETRLGEIAQIAKPSGSAGGAAAPGPGSDGPGKPEGQDASKADPGAAPEAGRSGMSLPRDEIKKIVREAIRDEEEERARKAEIEKEGEGKEQRKPKKTISEVAKELGLSLEQEQKLQDLHRDMSNDLMKVLFEVPDDQGLPQLRAQLKEAEHNPEVKQQLAEKLVYNWTISQTKVTAVVLKAYTRVASFLKPDQVKAIDKYDLQADKPEWPDIEKMFFPKPEEKKEGE